MKKKPYTKCGKCGDTVWQRGRYGQLSYPHHRPANPRTARQEKARRQFATVSRQWHALTEEQRGLWRAAARSRRTRRRLGRDWPMTGFNCFVQVNMPRLNRGLALVEVPPGEV